jgi:THO complex subunit 1
MLPNKGKGLVFLRVCNELLRRLSKTQNTIFCGRIMSVLASVFSLCERSGVNVRGEFNTENTTLYNDRETLDISSVLAELASVNKGDLLADAHFYFVFWKLQDFFSNPPSVGVVLEAQKCFQACLDLVLDVFDAVFVAERKSNQPPSKQADDFFAKYLTHPNLLSLQVHDLSFRRYILVQALIFLQYLNVQAVVSKEAADPKDVMASDYIEWMHATEKKIYALLQSTRGDGEAFCTMVQRILLQEQHWVHFLIHIISFQFILF